MLVLLYLVLFLSDLLPFSQGCGCGNNGGGGGGNGNNQQTDYFPLLLGYLIAAAAGASGRKAARKQGIAIDRGQLRSQEDLRIRRVCNGYWTKKSCRLVRDEPLFIEPYVAKSEKTVEIFGVGSGNTKIPTTKVNAVGLWSRRRRLRYTVRRKLDERTTKGPNPNTTQTTPPTSSSKTRAIGRNCKTHGCKKNIFG